MPRALFKKSGEAIYISHLDLMRLFQRAFKRANLQLTHTKGFNPRPSVSIALPLSLGVESQCELLDFELEGESISNKEIKERLNQMLIPGVEILDVYDSGNRIKNLLFLECSIVMEYDAGIPENAVCRINELFSQYDIYVEKKSKNGITEQNIKPMIHQINVNAINQSEIVIRSLICCQNPSLNPAQLHAAVCKYIPDLAPDFVRIHRLEVYDNNKSVFR